WQRDTAQQTLLWRNDKAAVPALEKMARSSPRPLARLHALCTLDGHGALEQALLEDALTDENAGVVRQAIRLCETHLKNAPGLSHKLATLGTHPDTQVR